VFVYAPGKFAALVNLLMDFWNISPKQGKTVKVMCMLILTVHVCGCFFWLWKVR